MKRKKPARKATPRPAAEIIRLSRADQIAFAKALINPPEPNAKLLAAMRRHAAMIRR